MTVLVAVGTNVVEVADGRRVSKMWKGTGQRIGDKAYRLCDKL